MSGICESGCRHARPLGAVVEDRFGRLNKVIKDVLTSRKVNDGYPGQFLALLGDDLQISFAYTCLVKGQRTISQSIDKTG